MFGRKLYNRLKICQNHHTSSLQASRVCYPMKYIRSRARARIDTGLKYQIIARVIQTNYTIFITYVFATMVQLCMHYFPPKIEV